MDLRLVLVILAFSSINCRNTLPVNLDNVVPGHLELWNPELFEKIFPNIDSQVDSRIVGGIEVTPHSRPYQVGIIVPVSGGSQFCGASLINTMNILTAAHCVDILVGNLTAYLGAHNMLPTAAENATVLQTDEVVVYPLWNRSIILHDIALVHLKEPVELTTNIQPIDIPEDDSDDYVGQTSLVTGWGRPVETVAGISPVLNELTSHVMSNYPCRLAYLGYVEDSNICMSSYLGNATCSGDSGGPLAVDGVQVGVVSFGSGWGCAQGFPSVFARVTYYLEWIRENLKAIPETTTTVTAGTTTTETTTASTESSSETPTTTTIESSSTESSSETTTTTTTESTPTTESSSETTITTTTESTPTTESSSETTTTTESTPSTESSSETTTTTTTTESTPTTESSSETTTTTIESTPSTESPSEPTTTTTTESTPSTESSSETTTTTTTTESTPSTESSSEPTTTTTTESTPSTESSSEPTTTTTTTTTESTPSTESSSEPTTTTTTTITTTTESTPSTESSSEPTTTTTTESTPSTESSSEPTTTTTTTTESTPSTESSSEPTTTTTTTESTPSTSASSEGE